MQDNVTISQIRKDYKLKSLSEKDVDPDAIAQFGKWWNEAVKSSIEEPNGMTLATASQEGFPSARLVLLKGFNEKGFNFFTNYNSFKARQLKENPRACLVFWWKELERQVRITGIIEKLTDEENNEYFNSRPEGSRIAAIISPQSEAIPDRKWLEDKVVQIASIFPSEHIKRPNHWGGYRVKPAILEFWQGRPNRLHDRIQYVLEENGSWKIERLAP